MPKPTALRFRSVREAIAWLANPPPEQYRFMRQIKTEIVHYKSFQRPPGLRAHYEDGARRFRRAALQANLLAFELECEYAGHQQDGLPVDEVKIAALAKKLLPLARQCHRWGAGKQGGVDLDGMLNAVNVLGPIGAPPPDSPPEMAWRYQIPNRVRGLTRSDVLSVSTAKGNEVPDWWVSDASRMRTEAINLRRVSFMFDHWAAGERKPKGGRPRDGNDSFLLQFARMVNLSRSTVAFLMAASLVLPSNILRTAVPKGLLNLQKEARDGAYTLTEAETIFLGRLHAHWVERLTAAAKAERRWKQNTAKTAS
jgi:hypothetical protein